MTTVEAAMKLGITPATVRRQIEQGRIAARKVGRDWHVTPREVERYRAESLGQPGQRGRKAGYAPDGSRAKA